MEVPEELSIISENFLTKLLFDLIESSDNGISKCYLWANEEMQFSLINDRGYYECFIVPHKKPINPLDIIRLLRFLKNDKIFYNKELIEANLSYTLAIDEYVVLFYDNYSLIKEFIASFNQEQYDNYNKFKFNYEGR